MEGDCTASTAWHSTAALLLQLVASLNLNNLTKNTLSCSYYFHEQVGNDV
jgi:hypothetical protein